MEKISKNFLRIALFLTLSFTWVKKVLADFNLEVSYPTISGRTLTSATTLPEYVRYVFDAGMIIGFFAVFVSFIIAGATYILSPVSVEARANAKDRFSGAISGLLLLVLTYLIVTTINPQISVLTLNSLPQVPPPPMPTKPAGVYFYKTAADCPVKDPQKIATSNVFDFNELNNQITGVGIVNKDQTSYISVLFEKPNLWGKCQYINPNNPCTTLANAFATSASVHQYDFTPNGDGVYFYRKPCYDKITNWQQTADADGLNKNILISHCNNANLGLGYLKVSNQEIKSAGIYVKKLNQLSFIGNGGGCTVPENERTCIQYNINEDCTNWACPALDGKNISSIIINGSYVVMFVYKATTDDPYGPWTSCQEFPLPEDTNRIGPQQIKLEKIRNSMGVIPTHVLIIPVKN